MLHYTFIGVTRRQLSTPPRRRGGETQHAADPATATYETHTNARTWCLYFISAALAANFWPLQLSECQIKYHKCRIRCVACQTKINDSSHIESYFLIFITADYGILTNILHVCISLKKVFIKNSKVFVIFVFHIWQSILSEHVSILSRTACYVFWSPIIFTPVFCIDGRARALLMGPHSASLVKRDV